MVGRRFFNCIHIVLGSFYVTVQYFVWNHQPQISTLLPQKDQDDATSSSDLHSSLTTFRNDVIAEESYPFSSLRPQQPNKSQLRSIWSDIVKQDQQTTFTKNKDHITNDDEDSKFVIVQGNKEKDETNDYDDEYFGACLLIMDDNHLLPEWLAYHYTFLPLRRLIVAVDPNSQTSPKTILNRFGPYMNITIWNDNSYNFNPKPNRTATENHRSRQKKFIQKCLTTLKQDSQTKWVAFLDTDEFVVPNWKANGKFKIHNYTPQMSVLDIMKANPNARYGNRQPSSSSTACFANHRFRVTIKESLPSDVYQNVPDGIDANALMTLRYRYNLAGQPGFPHGKSFVDISKLSFKDIKFGNHNVHRPVKTLCNQGTLKILLTRSPFVIHHYAGTLETFLYRNDPRTDIRNEAMYYELFGNFTPGTLNEDDSARFWISNFLTKVGSISKAQELLEGAGKIV